MWYTGVLLLLRLVGFVSRGHPWHARETNATLTRAFCPWFVALAGSTACLSHLHRFLQSQPGEILSYKIPVHVCKKKRGKNAWCITW